MSYHVVQAVLGRLISDQAFRQRLQARNGDCLTGSSERDIRLSDLEIAALNESDLHLWSRMATLVDCLLESDLLRRPGGRQRSGRHLTDRQQRVLRGVVDGLTNKEIAVELGVSEGAVKGTLQQLFRKARVRTRARLVRVALEGSLGSPRHDGVAD